MAIKIARDKKKHFYVGIPLGLVLQFAAAWLFPLSPQIWCVVSFLTLVGICYGFEIFSLVTGKGHYDYVDAIAGIIGGLLGMAIWWSIHAI